MPKSNAALRVIVAAIAIPVIVAAAYFGNYFFLVFAGLVGLLSLIEFYNLAKKKNAYPNYVMGIIALLFLIINPFGYFLNFFYFLLFWVPILLLIELFRTKGSVIYNLGATVTGVLYIGLFTAALIGIREFYPPLEQLYVRGGYLIISIFATIWICDSAAYYGGTVFGKHKLFPRVSPNKSWEGAIFGFIFSIIAMIAAKLLVLDFLTWKNVVAVGVIIGIFGQVGDLVESLIKRDAGVKDSSSFIPGHGGIFDRFDSLLFTSPIIYTYLKLFA